MAEAPLKATLAQTGDKGAGQTAPDGQAGQTPKKPWDGLKGKERETVRDDYCLMLRESGYPLKTIAKEAGYADPSGARKAANRSLKRMGEDNVAETRLVLLNRLERLLQAVWRTALTGDLPAVREARRIIETEAIMSGANAPTKLEVYTLDAIDQELARIEAELATLPDN